MRGTKSRHWWPLLAVAVLVAAAVWLLYAVWRSKHRVDLATYGGFAFPVLVLAGGWVGWAWRRAGTGAASSAADSQDLDMAADRLAAAVQAQWDKEAGERSLAGEEPIEIAWGRPSLPVAGPLAAAVTSRRFQPLPGLAAAGEQQFTAGRVSGLYAIFGGLGSGRLVIAGSPGSGKSGAAVLLILAALRHRDQITPQDRPQVPVPLLVTATDWDPRHQSVAAWLTGQLRETYPLFTGPAGATTAAALISAGKIMVIIDGLDEIATDLQPVALEALSQQANFRLVVLSRTAEMASAAARRGILQGAASVELRTIDPADAASYLERVQIDPPPAGWADLIEHLRSEPLSPLSHALDSPLSLTLVRDTYQSGDDARDLLDYCDSLHSVSSAVGVEAITDYLLDRVLPAAYAARPGQPTPRYDLATTHAALARIAILMNHAGTRDLQWWRIPEWVPALQRRFATGIGTGLVAGLMVGLAAGMKIAPKSGLTYGIALGLVFGLVAGLAPSSGGRPRRMGRLRPRKALNKRNVVVGLVAGLAVGLAVALAVVSSGGAELGSTIVEVLVYGLTSGLIFGLVFGLMDALADTESANSLSPLTSWRDNWKFHLAVGLGSALLLGLALWFALGPGLGPVLGPVLGLAVGLTGSRLLATFLGSVQVALKRRVPVRLMSFLDDAHRRSVLRTLGPAYQFRHARLQDRLAESAKTRPKTSPVEPTAPSAQAHDLSSRLAAALAAPRRRARSGQLPTEADSVHRA